MERVSFEELKNISVIELGHLYVKLLCLKFGFELVMGLPAYQIEWTRRASRRPCDVKINMAAQDAIFQTLNINNFRYRCPISVKVMFLNSSKQAVTIE